MSLKSSRVMLFSLARTMKPVFYLQAWPNSLVWHSRLPSVPPSLPDTCVYIHHSPVIWALLDFPPFLKVPCACLPLARCFSLNRKHFPSLVHILILLVLKIIFTPGRFPLFNYTEWVVLLCALCSISFFLLYVRVVEDILFLSENCKLFHLFIHQIFNISVCGMLG